VGALPGIRPLLGAVLFILASPGVARVVPIKADPNANITWFRLVPPDVVEGLSGGRLRDKVVRFRRQMAPAGPQITLEWLVFAECDGRFVDNPQPLTPSTQLLQISCSR
jgi:hypothetical protein